jgi:hypothetical protein
MRVFHFFVGFIFTFVTTGVFANTIPDPCGPGPAQVFALIDRPGASYSACTIPFGNAMLEMGYQYFNLAGGAGYQYNFPQPEFRIGLPYRNEIFLFPSNYNIQSQYPRIGYSAAAIGAKHEFGYNDKWIAAILGFLTLPSGSRGFGSANYGGELNLVSTYNISPNLALTLMLGVSSDTLPHYYGGERFNSLNPDMLLAYQFNDWFQLYGEVYGQTNSGPGLGAGYAFDTGLMFLPTRRIEWDIEVGQNFYGKTGFNNYIGTGIGIFFG